MRLLLLVPLLPACVTDGSRLTAPPHYAEQERVLVRGHDLEEARRVVGESVDLDRKVRDLFAATDPPTPEIWLLDRELDGPGNGYSNFGPAVIVLEKGSHDSRHMIAHELAHHYQRRWPSRLPGVVEEGLSDLVGGMVRDQVGEVRERYAPILARTRVKNIDSVLRISAEEIAMLKDSRVTRPLRSIGFAIADRIGFEELQRMCARASELGLERVPADWFEPTWAEVSDQSFQGSEPPPGVEIVTFR